MPRLAELRIHHVTSALLYSYELYTTWRWGLHACNCQRPQPKPRARATCHLAYERSSRASKFLVFLSLAGIARQQLAKLQNKDSVPEGDPSSVWVVEQTLSLMQSFANDLHCTTISLHFQPEQPISLALGGQKPPYYCKTAK